MTLDFGVNKMQERVTEDKGLMLVTGFLLTAN